jgi:subtilisin
MSLGGSGSKDGECTDDGFNGDDSLHHAICNAKNDGVVFAVAAGNDGDDDGDAEGSVPAAYDDAVITASATTQGDDWPDWSKWGDESAGWTENDSAPVAIAAPGVDILSTRMDGGTTTKSGTSMASPHVAGAAALFLGDTSQSADGSAFSNTRQSLLDGAESTDGQGWDNTSGNPHDEDFLDVR